MMSLHILNFFAGIQRVTDADLIALVSDEVFQPEVVWKLLDMQVNLDFILLFFFFFFLVPYMV